MMNKESIITLIGDSMPGIKLTNEPKRKKDGIIGSWAILHILTKKEAQE